VGSKEHRYCRQSSKTMESVHLKDLAQPSNGNFTALVSYHTCGNLETSATNSSGTIQLIAGTKLYISLTADSPNVVKMDGSTPISKNLGGWSGIYVDFIYNILSATSPRIAFELDDSWASTLSQREWPTDNYTACVLDVAVNNYDLCLGAFWMTPERTLHAHFLPPISIDEFLFIARVDDDDLSLRSILSLPFRPFQLEVWILVFVFGICAAVILYACEHGHKNVSVFGSKHEYVAHICKTFYCTFDGLMGGLRFPVNSVPARLANLGFSFVSTLLLAGYTAHLAGLQSFFSILVCRMEGTDVAMSWP